MLCCAGNLLEAHTAGCSQSHQRASVQHCPAPHSRCPSGATHRGRRSPQHWSPPPQNRSLQHLKGVPTAVVEWRKASAAAPACWHGAHGPAAGMQAPPPRPSPSLPLTVRGARASRAVPRLELLVAGLHAAVHHVNGHPLARPNRLVCGKQGVAAGPGPGGEPEGRRSSAQHYRAFCMRCCAAPQPPQLPPQQQH